jgi:hypothetical protein
MPITKAKTDVIDLNKDTNINGIKFGKGNGTDANNIAIGNGAQATVSAIGYNNISIGTNALNKVNVGGSNVAIGTQSQSNVTGASANVSIGDYTLTLLTNNYWNTAIGSLNTKLEAVIPLLGQMLLVVLQLISEQGLLILPLGKHH